MMYGSWPLIDDSAADIVNLRASENFEFDLQIEEFALEPFRVE